MDDASVRIVAPQHDGIGNTPQCNVQKLQNKQKEELYGLLQHKKPEEDLKQLFRNYRFACIWCSSHNTLFEYLNNWKKGRSCQPRYKCRTCGRHWTVGGKVNNRVKDPNYEKPVEKYVCPNENCKSSNTRFDYYNNHNRNQPTYICRTCKHKFRPVSKRNTKRRNTGNGMDSNMQLELDTQSESFKESTKMDVKRGLGLDLNSYPPFDMEDLS